MYDYTINHKIKAAVFLGVIETMRKYRDIYPPCRCLNSCYSKTNVSKPNLFYFYATKVYHMFVAKCSQLYFWKGMHLIIIYYMVREPRFKSCSSNNICFIIFNIIKTMYFLEGVAQAQVLQKGF